MIGSESGLLVRPMRSCTFSLENNTATLTTLALRLSEPFQYTQLGNDKKAGTASEMLVFGGIAGSFTLIVQFLIPSALDDRWVHQPNH